MKAQMTPVHSLFHLVRLLLSTQLVEMKLTKANKNKVCRPRNATSRRGLIIRVEIDRSPDDTTRIPHSGPNP